MSSWILARISFVSIIVLSSIKISAPTIQYDFRLHDLDRENVRPLRFIMFPNSSDVHVCVLAHSTVTFEHRPYSVMAFSFICILQANWISSSTDKVPGSKIIRPSTLSLRGTFLIVHIRHLFLRP